MLDNNDDIVDDAITCYCRRRSSHSKKKAECITILKKSVILVCSSSNCRAFLSVCAKSYKNFCSIVSAVTIKNFGWQKGGG